MVKTIRAKSMLFKLHAPTAKRVSLAGNFNSWSTSELNAKKDARGNWAVKVGLKPGRYEYKFFVDGSWMADPRNKSNIYNQFGSQNSIIEIK